MDLARSALVITPIAAALAGCSPSIHVEVLRPADISLPAQIQTLAVVDRSAPKNVGQAILGSLEGMVTGEGVLHDREAASQCVNGLVWGLTESPRFEVAIPNLANEDAESSIWARELSWPAARRIARTVEADALVTLDAFDSDSFMEVTTEVRETSDGVKKTVYNAERETRVLSAWRIYDVENKVILDDIRDHTVTRTWREEGSSRADAQARLPRRGDTVVEMGRVAGEAYAMRIAPSYIWVTRQYYGKKYDELKEAKRYVKARDWQGATEIWLRAVESPDRKLRGMAAYDLALAMEVGGDLEGALQWSKKAAVDLANGRSRRYVSTLERRLWEQARLAEQMAPPPPEEPPSPLGPNPARVEREQDEERDGVMTRPDR